MKAEAMEEAQEAFLAALPHHPDSLEKEYYRANTSAERKEEIDVLYDAIEAEKKAPYITYIKENPYSPYSVAILQKSYMGDFSIDELSAMVDSMQQQVTLQGNRLVKEVAATVAIMKATAVGQIAPDFTQNDPDGNPITFSDVYKKNKLTMIDFWASWCGPCRRFNPTLVKLYEKYHRKGFEIMAVSLDQTHEKWVKGIADDKLTWPQVSDLKYWNSEVAKQYNIRLIPQNVFVDADGKIVAKRVSEDEMDTFIAGQLAK